MVAGKEVAETEDHCETSAYCGGAASTVSGLDSLAQQRARASRDRPKAIGCDRDKKRSRASCQAHRIGVPETAEQMLEEPVGCRGQQISARKKSGGEQQPRTAFRHASNGAYGYHSCKERLGYAGCERQGEQLEQTVRERHVFGPLEPDDRLQEGQLEQYDPQRDHATGVGDEEQRAFSGAACVPPTLPHAFSAKAS